MAEIVCPKCGEPVNPAETLWQLAGKWYCSEKCARKALGAWSPM